MSHELATTTGGSDAIQIAQHIGQIQVLGTTLIKSGMLPQGVKSPEAAVAIILKGRELGVPPMQALSHIHVISGKPTLSAELMLAMVMKAGHEVWIVETNGERCAIAGKRRGSDREQSLTFSMEDAKRAGVLNNPTWKKYPDAMLRARAISAFCRMFAPDVLMGASYTPEELGAEVDGEGEVLDVTYSEPQEEPAAVVMESDPTPAPVAPQERTLTAEEAARLAEAIKKAGTPAKEHLALASDVTGRTIGALSELTVSESKAVHAKANGQEVAA